jgi:hypothetical protein
MNMTCKTILLAAAAFAAAAPVHGQGLLKSLAGEARSRLVSSLASGELPRLPSLGGAAGAAGGFQRYGNWEFKLEQLKTGPDEQWQAVVGVRNAAGYRQGMVASEIRLFLITEDGETLSSWGELYKASVEGPSVGLEPVAGTLWLEPGDQTRVRLRFDGSRGLKPVKIRIQSSGATAEKRTFPVN